MSLTPTNQLFASNWPLLYLKPWHWGGGHVLSQRTYATKSDSEPTTFRTVSLQHVTLKPVLTHSWQVTKTSPLESKGRRLFFFDKECNQPAAHPSKQLQYKMLHEVISYVWKQSVLIAQHTSILKTFLKDLWKTSQSFTPEGYSAREIGAAVGTTVHRQSQYSGLTHQYCFRIVGPDFMSLGLFLSRWPKIMNGQQRALESEYDAYPSAGRILAHALTPDHRNLPYRYLGGCYAPVR